MLMRGGLKTPSLHQKPNTPYTVITFKNEKVRSEICKLRPELSGGARFSISIRAADPGKQR